MFIIRLLRWLRGNVRFSAIGGFANKLINDCTSEKIHLWDIAGTDMGFEANTFSDSYRYASKLAKKSCTKLHIKQKSGLHFWLFHNRKRWGMFCGGFCCALLLAAMSMFVWTVDISGNDTLDEEFLHGQLAGLGVTEGVLHSSIDADFVERSMLVANDRLSWIAVNVEGSRVRVIIKERIVPPISKHNHNKPANIVALYGGVVKKVEAYTGQPVVAVGNVVAKGDLLISGIIETQHGRTMLRRATGKVIIEHKRELGVAVPLKKQVQVETGEHIIQNKIKFIKLEIPLGLQKEPQWNFVSNSSEKRFEIFGVRLPVILQSTIYRRVENHDVILAGDELMKQAFAQLEITEQAEFAGAEIIEKHVSSREADGFLLLEGEYLVRDDVGTQREFYAD